MSRASLGMCEMLRLVLSQVAHIGVSDSRVAKVSFAFPPYTLFIKYKPLIIRIGTTEEGDVEEEMRTN